MLENSGESQAQIIDFWPKALRRRLPKGFLVKEEAKTLQIIDGFGFVVGHFDRGRSTFGIKVEVHILSNDHSNEEYWQEQALECLHESGALADMDRCGFFLTGDPDHFTWSEGNPPTDSGSGFIWEAECDVANLCAALQAVSDASELETVFAIGEENEL